MEHVKDPAKLVGRVLLAIIFIVAGYGKIGGYAGTVNYMESQGVPGILLPLVILVELGGGILVALGFFSRWSALAIAGFSILAAILFHFDLGDRGQTTQLMKNLAIAGGMLLLFASGPGKFAINDK